MAVVNSSHLILHLFHSQMLRNRARRLRQHGEESGADLSQSRVRRAVEIMVAMGQVHGVERRFWARETSTDWWDRIVLQLWQPGWGQI